MNSPWGYLHQVVKETGWDIKTILWKVNAANIQLMMADRLYLSDKKEKEQGTEAQGLDFLRNKYRQ